MEFTDEQSAAFAAIFTNARARSGLRQKDVAQRTGVSATTLATIERAVFPGVRFIDIARLARFYGLSLNHIAETLGL